MTGTVMTCSVVIEHHQVPDAPREMVARTIRAGSTLPLPWQPGSLSSGRTVGWYLPHFVSRRSPFFVVTVTVPVPAQVGHTTGPAVAALASWRRSFRAVRLLRSTHPATLGVTWGMRTRPGTLTGPTFGRFT